MLVSRSKYINTKQLVVSLKNKELDAFEYLYDQFSSKMYHYIQLSIPKEDAEQILENCFINLWNQIDQYNFDGHFYIWIVAATNKEIYRALNEQEKRQRKINRALNELFCTRNVLNTPASLIMKHGY